MSESGAKRPWLAALLALVPGLGHAYLGLWGRSFVWTAMTVVTAVLFFPADDPGVASPAELASAEPSAPALFVLGTVIAMAAVDAYWHASAGLTGGGGGESRACPECGKPVDEDLAFCQWCTAELE